MVKIPKFLKPILLTLTLGLLFIPTQKAYAAGEVEPNDTKTEAMQINRNNAIDSLSTESIFASLSDANDEDWYRVYLGAGDQTLAFRTIVNNNEFNVSIVDEDNVPAFQSIFGPTSPKQVKFKTTKSGIYYLHVKNHKGDFSKKAEYGFTLGNPVYASKMHTVVLNYISLSTLTLTSPTVSFNLTNVASIPDEAILHKVSISGYESGSAHGRKRYVKAASAPTWIRTDEYIFEKDNLHLNPIKLKQNWSFKHEASGTYSKPYSLQPYITFEYFYEYWK